MAGGAPKGNQNARKGKLWTQAIERALKKRSKSKTDMIEALDEIAEKLLAACDNGDLSALKELGDRLEGKAAQTVEMTIQEMTHEEALELLAQDEPEHITH